MQPMKCRTDNRKHPSNFNFLEFIHDPDSKMKLIYLSIIFREQSFHRLTSMIMEFENPLKKLMDEFSFHSKVTISRLTLCNTTSTSLPIQTSIVIVITALNLIHYLEFILHIFI